MIELDTSLSQARLARGLTLEDAERSTRIARKYIIALEEQNYAVFPAPVYARGFLRTYCRYLGIDPEPHLEALPAGWSGGTPSVQSAPAGRSVSFNVAWLAAGVLIAALAAGAFLLLQNQGGGTGDLQTTLPPDSAQNTEPPPRDAGVGVPVERDTQSVGRPLDPGLPGVLPDLSGVGAEEAIDFLETQGIEYLLIEQSGSEATAGVITWQSAPSGTPTDDLSELTLAASIGADQETSREDCDVLRGANRRSATEQTWYEANCLTPPTAVPPPDRTSCAEIRGTAYRSHAERQFFLANCTG